jgi:ABC-type transport system substrate-binding protein
MGERSVRRAAAVLAAALLVTACSGGGGGGGAGEGGGRRSGPPRHGGTLVIGLAAETDGWDPAQNRWARDAYWVAQAVYDPLMALDEKGVPRPYLAESVTPNADLTAWTVKLRPGIRFHDGRPLDARAVKAHFDRIKASPLVGQAMRPLVATDVVDDLTVVLRSDRPWGTLPYFLVPQTGFIEAPGADNADHPVGTGPFVFKEWVRDDHLTVERNPNYWRPGLPRLDRITFRPMPEEATRLAALRSGQARVIWTGSPETITSARRDRSLRTLVEVTDEVHFIMLNMDAPPLDDLRVRRALALATDRPRIIRLLSGGVNAEPAEGPWSKGSKWYVPTGFPGYDLAGARRLLEDYKRDTGATEVKVTLGSVPGPAAQQEAELIRSMWEAAGVKVELRFTEQTRYINEALVGNYQANAWVQFGALDPDIDYIWWHSSNANPPPQIAINFARLRDPAIDAALDRARGSTDDAFRKTQYGIVARRMAELVPYIWIANSLLAVVHRSDVHGVGEGTLPDGSPAVRMRVGIVPVAPIWLDR